jgi:GNAT superfamily N-acetyltransferase
MPWTIGRVIEIRRVPGDDPEAVAMVAAMESEVQAALGPMTPERTSTVAPTEMVPPAGWFVLLCVDGAVVAGGGVRRLSAGVGEIKRMYVLPEHRGRGLGVELVREMIDNGPYAARRWLLHTRDAHELYRRFGFGPPGERLMERPPAA